MIFNLSTVFVSTLALLSAVSAGPISERKNTSCKHKNAYPVIVVNDKIPIAGYYLGVGKNGVPVVTSKQTGVVDASLTEGSLGWFDGSSCKEEYLNYGSGEGSHTTQSLVFEATVEVFSWKVELGHSLWNSYIQSGTFQICEEDKEWVVTLTTSETVEYPTCYYTELGVRNN